MSEPWSRQWPKIPQHGLAAQLSSNVLVSRIGELAAGPLNPGATVSAPSRTGGLQSWGKHHDAPSSPTRAWRTPRNTAGLTNRRMWKTLYELECGPEGTRFHEVRQPTSAGDCDGHDEGEQEAARIPGEEWQLFRTVKALGSDATAEPTDKNRPCFRALAAALPPLLGAEVDGNQLSKSAANSRPLPTPGGSLRSLQLQNSFLHEPAEVEAKLLSLDRFLQVAKHTGHGLEYWTAGSQAFPNVSVIRDALEQSLLTQMPPKPVALAPPKEDQGAVPWQARREEIALCVANLNFFRWLCGLSPVVLGKEAVTACDAINEVLLPRTQSLSRTAEGHMAAKKRLETLSNSVADLFQSEPSPLLVLQGDGSLVDAIEHCLSACHMSQPGVHRRLDCAAPGARAALVRDMITFAQEGIPEAPARPPARLVSRGYLHMPRAEVTLHSMPSALRPLRLFWELHGLQGDTAAPVQWPPTPEGFDSTLLPAPRVSVVPAQPTHQSRPRRSRQPGGPGGERSGAFWGDQQGAVAFRRYLLSPRLHVFGAARQRDTCVLWVAPSLPQFREAHRARACEEGASHSSDLVSPQKVHKKAKMGIRCAAKLRRLSILRPGLRPQDAVGREPLEFVSFPPPGIVPLEIVQDLRVPWTVMPDTSLYQPSANTKVRVWRIDIHRPPDRPWYANRLEEIAVGDHIVDCSLHGNPFCIIFRPRLTRIVHGDQFEVVIEGLRGDRSEFCIFHDIRQFRQRHRDRHLLEAAALMRKMLGDAGYWGPVKASLPPARGPINWSVHSPVGSDSSSEDGEPPEEELDEALAGETDDDAAPTPPPVIGLVTHPDPRINTDSADLTVVLQSTEVAAIRASVYVNRVSAETVIRRGAFVRKVGDRFCVSLKLPMPNSRYVVHFAASTKASPQALVQHPLHYAIFTSARCPTLLASLEHPLAQKFGYMPLSPVAQLRGIQLLAPLTYRVSFGHCYFLLHVPLPDSQEETQHSADEGAPPVAAAAPAVAAAPLSARTPGEPSQLRKTRLMRSSSTSLFSERLHLESTQALDDGGGELREFHGSVRRALEPHCQDAGGEVHLDLSVHGGRYVLRLRQRHDFPELHEAYARFGEDEIGNRIELCLRLPRLHAAEYKPQKLGEWLVTQNEMLPKGF